jgi:hypothetical protein
MDSKKFDTSKKWYHDILQSWKKFVVIVLYAPSLVILVISIFLYFYSKGITDPVVISLLNLILSLLTGLLGGFYAKKWDDLTEKKVTHIRGTSASQGLYLVLRSTIALEIRVSTYLQRFVVKPNPKNETLGIVKVYLEEIIGECVNLEDEIANSIQAWADIIPNADIDSVIKYIREVKEKYISTQSKLQDVNIELKALDNSKEENEQLLKRQRELTAEVARLKQDIYNKAYAYPVPAISGSFITGGTFDTNLELGSQISGKDFKDINVVDLDSATELLDTLDQTTQNTEIKKRE